MFCINADYSEIDESNRAFAKAVGDNLDLTNIQKSVINTRKDYAIINEVTQFNNENIFFKQIISKLLDIKLILNENNTCQKKYGEDGVHPNIEGYKLMEKLLLEKL